MITSTLIQAAEVALKELQATYSPEELPEMLADTGIGPRAFEHLATSCIDQYKNDVQTAVRQALLIGIYTERYNSNLEFDVMGPDDVLDIAGEEPAYEGADLQDIQDVLSCAFGITTADDIVPEELGKLLMNSVLGGLFTEDDPDETGQDPASQDGPILDP